MRRSSYGSISTSCGFLSGNSWRASEMSVLRSFCSKPVCASMEGVKHWTSAVEVGERSVHQSGWSYQARMGNPTVASTGELVRALTSKHDRYALQTSPHRFSYSAALALMLSCLCVSFVSPAVWLAIVGGGTADVDEDDRLFTVLLLLLVLPDDDDDDEGLGAARARYSSNQWLKQESYFFLSGVHCECNESMVCGVCPDGASLHFTVPFDGCKDKLLRRLRLV